MTANTGNQIQEEDRITSIPPGTALAPSQSVLETLSGEDRELLEKLLSEGIEYIDHPILHEPQADVELFGVETEKRDSEEPRLTAASVVVEAEQLTSRNATLSGEQEQKLFMRFNYARKQIVDLLAGSLGAPLSEDDAFMILAWLHRALDARGDIVRMNVPLVLAMAKRTRLSNVDFNELISEGNMALLRSVEKFDCSRGFKFSTYACRAILKSFSRAAMKSSRYRGRFPTEFDPAIEKSDFVEKKREEHEEDCVDELKAILSKNLANLSEVEQRVIRERFAIAEPGEDIPEPKTLEQVGRIIGVTKERVRQIQNKALKKIREALEDQFLAA